MPRENNKAEFMHSDKNDQTNNTFSYKIFRNQKFTKNLKFFPLKTSPDKRTISLI